MKPEKQKILIFGLGYFERELIKTISKNWQVVAVDYNEEQINIAKKQMPGVQYLRGDVSSILTWKKLDLTDVRHIISTIRDRDVNLEVCRIARQVLKLKQPIMVLVYEDSQEDEALFKPFDAALIKPVKLGIQVIQKRLEKNISQAVNVGFGKGELIEVHVQSRSHLVDHRLKYLRPSQWHISAIYRQDELIIPTGHCRIKLGDRVVLVGDPKVLENVADILIKGSPQFPLQYGTDIVFPLHRDFSDHLDEAVYWLDKFKALRIRFIPFKKGVSKELTGKIKTEVESFKVGETVEIFKEIFDLDLNAGVMFVPSRRRWFQPCRAKIAFKKAGRPFLISARSFPYRGVIVSLNGPDPALALDTGFEIAGLAGIPMQALYVTLPREMRGAEEDKNLKKREEIIGDFEGIHRLSIPYQVKDGNPVIETLQFLKPFGQHLLVMVHDPRLSMSALKPTLNVAYLIARSTRISSLVVPVEETSES